MPRASSPSDRGTVYVQNIELVEMEHNTVDMMFEEDCVDVTDDGNIAIDLSNSNQRIRDFLDSNMEGIFGEVKSRLMDDGDVDSSAMVYISNFDDEYDDVELNDIGQEHQGSIVQSEAQIQDISSPVLTNVTSLWECTNGHDTVVHHQRWEDELDAPQQCSGAEDEDCRDNRLRRCANMGTQIDTQQMVLSETEKDDRNSRSLICEVDSPLIGEFERRDTVEIIAKVLIADRNNEPKVKPYLHILGYEPVGHTVDLDDDRVDNLQNMADESSDILYELKNSVAPEIVDKCNQNKAKLAMLCSMVKGAGHTDRDMIHVLLYGKRGSGKSKIMEAGEDIAEINQFVDAQTATRAGLTASANQSSKLRGEGEQWIVTSGSIPQAHDGTCFIDELDKAEERIQTSIANPMSSGRVIKKTAGNATLASQTSIVSACNPPNERYETEQPIDSLEIPTHLKNRFDIILRVDDEILNINKEREVLEEQMNRKSGNYDVEINKDTLKDYIALSKRQDPEITDVAQEEIIENILDLRMDVDANKVSIEMSGREQEKLTRLSSAIAKLRLSDEVREDDVQRAWKLMINGYQSITDNSLTIEVSGQQ